MIHDHDDVEDDQILTFTVTTRMGNKLQFFYNRENNLVVVDLIAQNERGGRELLRKTIDEPALLDHTKPKRRKTG